MGRTIVPLLPSAADLRPDAARSRAPGDTPIGQDAGVLAGVAPLAVAITADPAVALAGCAASRSISRCPRSRSRMRGSAANAAARWWSARRARRHAARGARGDCRGRSRSCCAPNMSLGVNLLFELAELAAARARRRTTTSRSSKRITATRSDAPSGTALGLGRGRGAGARQDARRRRPNTRATATPGRASAGRIGFSVLRGGDIVGEHRLVFAGPGRAGRARAPRPGPHRIRPGRTGRRALGRRPAARPLLHDGDILL